MGSSSCMSYELWAKLPYGLTFALLCCAWYICPGNAEGVRATSTAEFGMALADPVIDTILLEDTLVLNGSAWSQLWMSALNVSRNVTVQATEGRRQARVFVLLDFNGLVMLLTLAPGCTLRFVGLELANHFDLVGSSFRPVRLSPGGNVVVEDCVQRRLAGLPLPATVVNMVAADRTKGMGVEQNCSIINNFTYNSTCSPGRPLYWPQAINMYDYATAIPPDRSLASQGLYYGGYTIEVVRTYYVVDNFVSQSCLDKRPGSECVTLLLQQLAAQQSPSPPPPVVSQTQGSGTKNVGTIVAAAVVPTVILAGLLISATVWGVRRRQRPRGGLGIASSNGSGDGSGSKVPKQQLQDSDVEAPGRGWGAGTGATPQGAGAPTVAASLAAAPATTAVPAAVAAAGGGGDGCVFWGLDVGQQLPVWSAEGAAETHDTVSCANSPLAAAVAGVAGLKGAGCAAGGTDSLDMTSDYRSGDAYDISTVRMGSVGGSGRGCQPIFKTTLASASIALSGDSPGLSKSATAPEAALTPGQREGVRIVYRGSGGGGAKEVVGRGSPGGSPGGVGGSGPSPDVVSELELLARGLRSSIKDVQLRLEGVLGCGAYGTVYKGTWQGLPVAVKTLVFSASALGGSDCRRRRALQEAALCKSISHPNVIATYCAELEPLHGPLGGTDGGGGGSGGPGAAGDGRGDGPSGGEANRGGSSGAGSGSGRVPVMDYRLYIVQEFADGGPLWRLYGRRDLWPAPGEPNIPAVVSLAMGISRALTHLHSKRIIHGDLNPNNVLLKRDPSQPSGFIIKVGDFGLSVMLPEHHSHISNLRMGTMFYMCPAVVMKAQVGPASDVFSLGVMLWELYHGRPAGTRTEQGPRYCSVFPAFPPSCPPAYSAVALHCLQRQPVNRPPAAEVTERLEAVLAAYVPGAEGV